MTNHLQQSETRSGTILRHTHQAMRDGALKSKPFSERVAERYLADTPPANRTVKLREYGESGTSMDRAKKHNAQVIDRLIRGGRDDDDTKEGAIGVKTFPADLEDAWVLELPQPYRKRCEIELAARRGYMVVRDPRASDTPVQQTGDFACLLREFADVTTALAPIFANGTVDTADRPRLMHGMQELGELLASTVQAHRRISAALVESMETQAGNVTPMRARGQG